MALFWINDSKGDSSCQSWYRHSEESVLLYLASFICNPLPRGRLRYSYYSRTVGVLRCENHHDIHSRAEQERKRCRRFGRTIRLEVGPVSLLCRVSFYYRITNVCLLDWMLPTASLCERQQTVCILRMLVSFHQTAAMGRNKTYNLTLFAWLCPNHYI